MTILVLDQFKNFIISYENINTVILWKYFKLSKLKKKMNEKKQCLGGRFYLIN